MPDLSHFAINADDVPATRRFYESVFGWRFEASSAPSTWPIWMPRLPRRVGGRVVMEPSVITGVGRLAFVADPSGNVVGMMAYEQG